MLSLHDEMKASEGMAEVIRTGKVIVLAERWVFSHFTHTVHHYCGRKYDDPWSWITKRQLICRKCQEKIPENIRLIVKLRGW